MNRCIGFIGCLRLIVLALPLEFRVTTELTVLTMLVGFGFYDFGL